MEQRRDIRPSSSQGKNEQRRLSFTELLYKTGKKSQDTLGHIGLDRDPEQPLTLDTPREGHHDKAGDLIAGSGNINIYKHLEEKYGKIELDEKGEISDKPLPSRSDLQRLSGRLTPRHSHDFPHSEGSRLERTAVIQGIVKATERRQRLPEIVTKPHEINTSTSQYDINSIPLKYRGIYSIFEKEMQELEESTQGKLDKAYQGLLDGNLRKYDEKTERDIESIKAKYELMSRKKEWINKKNELTSLKDRKVEEVTSLRNKGREKVVENWRENFEKVIKDIEREKMKKIIERRNKALKARGLPIPPE